jgi:flagellin-like protein
MKAIIRKDDQAVSPVIATFLMVAFTVVLAAVLYVMVSGLITGPGTSKPTVAFGTVGPVTGSTFKNESLQVASASQAVAPSNYKVNLQAPAGTGSALAMPLTNGGSVVVTVGSSFYKITWTDIGGDLTLNGGDLFVVSQATSSAGTTPTTMTSGSYTFYLLWSDGSEITHTTFSVT